MKRTASLVLRNILAALALAMSFQLGRWWGRFEVQQAWERAQRAAYFEPDLVALSKARAEPIISLLRTYRDEHGAWPSRLDLVLKNQSELRPVAGRPEWVYWSSPDGAKCELRFGANEDCYPCWFWTSSSDEWHQDS